MKINIETMNNECIDNDVKVKVCPRIGETIYYYDDEYQVIDVSHDYASYLDSPQITIKVSKSLILFRT